jgi:hypothetical protein
MLFPHARKAATAIFGPDTDWSDKGRVRGTLTKAPLRVERG